MSWIQIIVENQTQIGFWRWWSGTLNVDDDKTINNNDQNKIIWDCIKIILIQHIFLSITQHEKLVRFIIIFYIWNQLLKNVLSCKFVICIKQIQSDFTSIWKKKFELESVDQYKINRNTEYHLKWCTGISLLYHCKNVTKSKNYM